MAVVFFVSLAVVEQRRLIIKTTALGSADSLGNPREVPLLLLPLLMQSFPSSFFFCFFSVFCGRCMKRQRNEQTSQIKGRVDGRGRVGENGVSIMARCYENTQAVYYSISKDCRKM